MQKVVVIYHSKTGITKRFAEEIGQYLGSKSLQMEVLSIADYKPENLENADYLFLGCWTSGLFFFMQHPDKQWKSFTAKLPDLSGIKIALFTTYKYLTGTMFKNMLKRISYQPSLPVIELKSRSGELSNDNIDQLNTLFKF